MPDHAPRLVALVLAICGVATLLSVPSNALFSDVAGTHQQLMLTFAGAMLSIAAFMPGLRLAAVATGLVTKLLFIAACVLTTQPALWSAGLWAEATQVVLLAGAGAMLLHALRREAAWDGVLPSRQGG